MRADAVELQQPTVQKEELERHIAANNYIYETLFRREAVKIKIIQQNNEE